MLSVLLNKGVKPVTKPTLPFGWHCFTLRAVQFYNLSLNFPRKHTYCTISLQERHFPTLLRHTKSINSIETEQHYFHIVLHFTFQKSMLINQLNK